MENIKLFLSFLRRFVSVTDEEFEKSIQPVLKIRRFRKKEFLLKEGEIENYFNFISKGIIRKYH
ncbi:MAG: Crp/Fnr family transcriptional regulator, partial [Chitinophagaceae bacterium]